MDNLTITDQTFNTDGRNIIATQLGKAANPEIYIICAHYDTVADYCADDNASGVAVLINLANRLKIKNDQAEIKRIAALVRFFELQTCLSYNLARYFDDQNAPVQCGHCSVCRGNAVKLEYSLVPVTIADEVIYQKVDEFIAHMAIKGVHNVGVETQCRFLAGMSVPLFARNKVRQLSGFALCEQQRYSDIKATLLGR